MSLSKLCLAIQKALREPYFYSDKQGEIECE